MQDFIRGLNSRPITSVMVHIQDMPGVITEFSNEQENSNGCKYRVLKIANIDVFMTEKQAEQIFKTLESKLYDETFAELEDKYFTERSKARHLEEELELFKERLREVV